MWNAARRFVHGSARPGDLNQSIMVCLASPPAQCTHGAKVSRECGARGSAPAAHGVKGLLVLGFSGLVYTG